MQSIIKIVGTGPGDPDYITPKALKAIRTAEILVGGRRTLDGLARPGQECCVVDKDLPAVVDYIKKYNGVKKVAVLVSGDTGFFSIAQYLKDHLKGMQLEFIPGISSLQYMFAKLQLSWQGVSFYSMHGRSRDSFPLGLSKLPIVALLTGGEWTVQAIAAHLLNQQVNARVSIGRNLSYPDEQLFHCSLKALPEDTQDYTNSVMVIFNEDIF